jgi:hypothetical protein
MVLVKVEHFVTEQQQHKTLFLGTDLRLDIIKQMFIPGNNNNRQQ